MTAALTAQAKAAQAQTKTPIQLTIQIDPQGVATVTQASGIDVGSVTAIIGGL